MKGSSETKRHLSKHLVLLNVKLFTNPIYLEAAENKRGPQKKKSVSEIEHILGNKLETKIGKSNKKPAFH